MTITTTAGALLPPKLKKGDTIGLIAPASFITQEQLDKTINDLNTLGFKIKTGSNVMKRWGYFAGTDHERAGDINQMFADPQVDAIMCVRGGYGCARMLDLIDYKSIARNPKIFMGYSDITALLYAFYKKSKLVGFHSTVGISAFNEYTKRNLFNIIENPVDKYIIEYEREPEATGELWDIFTVKPGIAEGILIGGNLALMASLIGTKYDVDYDNKIVFIEDISEQPYRIDRMLTQLIEAGKFNNAAGILCGVFDDCDIDGEKLTIENSLTLKEVIIDRLSNLRIPVLYGFSFGHVANKCTLPVGIKARMDTEKRQLILLEKAVND
jgi:muramoyltetrapeptide carboxypeptidase